VTEQADVVIVGAGAAGLMCGIFAARTRPGRRIVLLDGARRPGAKILVAGGGRCNVTHDQVSETAYAGSSRSAIRKVLRRFDVGPTVHFFREIGVELKREDTGKLFPVTDDAHTVLDALLGELARRGAELHAGCRVEAIHRADGMFYVEGAFGTWHAPRVVLATGGQALPKSGSDGGGYRLARGLGHRITARILPALVPLTLPAGHWITHLSGLTLETTVSVQATTGKTLAAFTGSTLCTHLGLSGPAVMDLSRYYLDARADDPDTRFLINWMPVTDAAALEADLLQGGRTSVWKVLARAVPERLARALCMAAEADPSTPCDQLPRMARRQIVTACTAMPLPITGSRGFTYAETTAGGIPLADIRLETMESRVCAGLHLCGEICDVDGRIGGYNFQWAWASGYVTGISLA